MTLDGSVATSLTAALVGYGLRCQFSSGDEGNATFRDEVRIAENYQSVYGLVMEEMVRCPFEIFSPRPIGRMDTRTRKGEIRIGEYTSFSVLVLVEAIDDQITRVEYFVYYSSLGYESYMKKLDAYLKNGKQMCK